MNIDQLVYALPRAWCVETRIDADGVDRYAGQDIARGQCISSSLLVQRHLGGNLMRCYVGGVPHYFNELDDGMWLDTTRRQFAAREAIRLTQRNPAERLYIFSNTWKQVDLLEQLCLKEIQ